MKNLSTIALDAGAAKKFIDEAKDILSASRIQKNRRLTAKESQDAWWRLDQADARLSGLLTYIHLIPAETGRLGGNKTSERGADYFRQIAAMRKTRAGGRPRKKASDTLSRDTVFGLDAPTADIDQMLAEIENGRT